MKPVYTQVLSAAIEVLRAPLDENDPLNSNDDDWWDLRTDLGNVIKFGVLNCLPVMEALQLVCNSLFSLGNNISDPNEMVLTQEAHFTALHHISGSQQFWHMQPSQDMNHPVYQLLKNLPVLMEKSCLQNMAQNQAENPSIVAFAQSTALQLYGSFSNWVLADEQQLQTSLNCLCTVIMKPSPDGQSSPAKRSQDSKPVPCPIRELHKRACQSFKEVCKQSFKYNPQNTVNDYVTNMDSMTCALLKYMNELLQVYEKGLTTLFCRPHLNVVEGVAFVVSKTPNSEIFEKALQSILSPLLTGMNHDQATSVQVSEVFDRLVQIITPMKWRPNVESNAEQLQQILSNLLEQHVYERVFTAVQRHASNDVAVEKATRFVKHAMRNQPDHFVRVVPRYVSCAKHCFNVKQLSPWLYAAEYLIQQYNDNANIRDNELKPLFQFMSRGALQTLQNMTEKDPDLIEDFYGMHGRYVQEAPLIVYQSDTFQATMELLFQCILIPANEAVDAILGFVEKIFQGPRSDVSDSEQNMLNEARAFVMNQYGPKFVSMCFAMLANVMPWKIVEGIPAFLCEIGGSCASMARDNDFHQWIVNALREELPIKNICSENELAYWTESLKHLCDSNYNSRTNEIDYRVGHEASDALTDIWHRCDKVKQRRNTARANGA